MSPFHTCMKAISTLLLICIGFVHFHAAEAPLSPPSGCADADPQKPSLVERLQTMWRDGLSKRDAFKRHKELVSQQISDNKGIMVLEIAGEEAFKRIDDTLAPTERSLIITGDLAALRKHPKLTMVHNPGTFGNGFSAYFDADGTLVLLWIIPEG